MCNVNISESLRVILDNECDCSDDQDNAYLYSDECDKYEVSDANKTHNTVDTNCTSLAYVGLRNASFNCAGCA